MWTLYGFSYCFCQIPINNIYFFALFGSLFYCSTKGQFHFEAENLKYKEFLWGWDEKYLFLWWKSELPKLIVKLRILVKLVNSLGPQKWFCFTERVLRHLLWVWQLEGPYDVVAMQSKIIELAALIALADIKKIFEYVCKKFTNIWIHSYANF